MKEEIQNSGAELNEAELTEVSGGLGDSTRTIALTRAKKICQTCDKDFWDLPCAHGPEGLADVMLARGMTSVDHFGRCPYFTERQKGK